MLMPTRRRTLAPRGQTPILNAWDRRDRISAISAITISPKRRRRNLLFQLLPDDHNVVAADVVIFLRQLRRHLPGPILLVWDRSRTHDRAILVREYLAKHPEIQTERLPGYAPELNPDEQVWANLKHGGMANFVPADTQALRTRLAKELRGIKHRSELLANFVRHALPMRF